MKIAEVCTKPVVIAFPEQALAVAASEMRAHEVGALVVVTPGDMRQRPIGILTDRDIVCGQVNQCADLRCLTVGEVMTRDPLCISAEAELTEALAMLASKAVRRAPVIDGTGALVGIVTLDDIVPALAGQLNELADTVSPRMRHRTYGAQESAAPRSAGSESDTFA
jgi:CBS domain-containing protein